MEKELADFELYSRNFLKIITKDGQLRPFVFNVYQKHLWKVIKEQIEQGKPVRIIILKARQLGISTFFSAYNFWLAATNFYKRCLIVANDSDATNHIFNLSKRYYDFLPKQIAPMTRYSNRKELVFANPDESSRDSNPGLLSSISVETAGKKASLGRGSTYDSLELTEVAFWPDQCAGIALTALMQVCPYIAGTTIVLESTANGMGGDGEEFYNRYMAAESGKSNFTSVFFPYYWNPEYRLPAHNMVLTPYEQDLLDKYSNDGMTKEALSWRRYKVANEMTNSASMTPEQAFDQEFPYCASVAFLLSGRPVFDPMRVQRDIDNLRNIEFKRGELI